MIVFSKKPIILIVVVQFKQEYSLFRLAERADFGRGFCGRFVAATGAFPFYRGGFFIQSARFHLVMQVGEKHIVASFDLNKVFEKTRDIVKTLGLDRKSVV